jgi:hypothetical protein
MNNALKQVEHFGVTPEEVFTHPFGEVLKPEPG